MQNLWVQQLTCSLLLIVLLFRFTSVLLCKLLISTWSRELLFFSSPLTYTGAMRFRWCRTMRLHVKLCCELARNRSKCSIATSLGWISWPRGMAHWYLAIALTRAILLGKEEHGAGPECKFKMHHTCALFVVAILKKIFQHKVGLV